MGLEALARAPQTSIGAPVMCIRSWTCVLSSRTCAPSTGAWYLRTVQEPQTSARAPVMRTQSRQDRSIPITILLTLTTLTVAITTIFKITRRQ